MSGDHCAGSTQSLLQMTVTTAAKMLTWKWIIHSVFPLTHPLLNGSHSLSFEAMHIINSPSIQNFCAHTSLLAMSKKIDCIHIVSLLSLVSGHSLVFGFASLSVASTMIFTSWAIHLLLVFSTACESLNTHTHIVSLALICRISPLKIPLISWVSKIWSVSWLRTFFAQGVG